MSVKQRAYLMMEVMISGAITAVAVVALMGQLADARTASISAGRDATAQALLRRELDRARTLGFNSVASVTINDIVETQLSGKYRRTWDVTAAQTEIMFNAQTSRFRDVTVTIARPGRTTDKTYQGVVRIYE